MGYRLMGRAHALLVRPDGQGTVEYVALMLLVAGLLAGVITAAKAMHDGGIASTVASKVKSAIEGVGGHDTPAN